jgi:hypothetical protein
MERCPAAAIPVKKIKTGKADFKNFTYRIKTWKHFPWRDQPLAIAVTA